MTAKPPLAAADAVKKLSRYCCTECGAKELFLYCWTFYLETRAVHQELDTLRETIYEQELRLRELEAELKDKQQSLTFLLNEVQHLPVSPLSSERASSSRLPAWTSVGVKLLWRAFDADQDGKLTETEWSRLKDALSAQHGDIDELRAPDSHDASLDRGPASLLALYGSNDSNGAADLQRDLKALGILFGSDELLANQVAACSARLAQSARETQALHAEAERLQSEVHEKARAITRLRETFASTKVSLDSKDAEIARIVQQHKQADVEWREARDRADECLRKLAAAEKDLTAATSAVIDMRALVEDQVNEKEKWQRYCWELEERLHDALHVSKAQERDLWKTRDAKRDEARKNMLLYMDAHRGKRHFVAAPTDQVQHSDPGCAQIGRDTAKVLEVRASGAVTDSLA